MSYSEAENYDKGVGDDTVVKYYTAGGTFSAGEHVKFDTSQTGEDRVKTVVQGTSSGLFVGIALEDGTSGETVAVAVKGYVEGARCTGSVASGNTLFPEASGELDAYANTDAVIPVGVALEADAGSGGAETADVWLYGINA